MEDEWKELLLTVPDTLLEVGTSEEALRLIGLAQSKLDARADLLCRIRLGVAMASALDGYVDPDPVGVCPSAILDDACREIKRRSSLHCGAGHVLLLCYEALDLLPSEEMCRSWDSFHDIALHHAGNAQKRLSNAASSAKAARDAIGMAGALQEGSALSRDWMLAAEQLLTGAINEVTTAVHLVHLMRRVVSLQFFDAWKILKSARRRRRRRKTTKSPVSLC